MEVQVCPYRGVPLFVYIDPCAHLIFIFTLSVYVYELSALLCIM